MKLFLFNLTGLFLVFLLYSCDSTTQNQQLSKAFEIRYVSSDTAANGVTDFKGPTAVFNTEERMTYLKKFANYGSQFFNDPQLNKQVVSESEIDSALQTLKPQPKPEVRRQIDINQWKYLGYKKGQRNDELQNIARWRQLDGASIYSGALQLDNHKISKSFSPQDWRMKCSWKIKPQEKSQNVAFNFSGGAIVGTNRDGDFYYMTSGKKVTAKHYSPDQYYNLKVEIDLEAAKYNFYVDGKLIADFVPLAEKTEAVDHLSINTDAKVLIDDIWGVGYRLGKRNNEHQIRTHPYYMHTFFDQDFNARPSPKGFQKSGYDDSGWQTVPYRRYAHGGERNRNEALYLRKKIKPGDFKRARLHVESVRPSGELYINGKRVAKLGRAPQTIDVGKWLRPNQQNLIAVKVNSFEVDKVRFHMNTDKWSSIFAGLMKLELTGNTYVNDAYVYTSKIDESANVQINVKVSAKDENGFSGTLVTDLSRWYPHERRQVAAHQTKKIKLKGDQPATIKENATVKHPKLWTTESPNLYKVHLKLKNDRGKVVDDYVLTTGLRTISQKGGTFRINGNPDILFGPLVFNEPSPLERVSQWMFSPPSSKWVETILETKKMNGNAIRMSVHDKRIAGVNDKRLARIGDQMGIMFMWQTPTWIREGGTEAFDFKNLPAYMKEVRNDPSIVMWQPGNHPTYSMDWYNKVYYSMMAVDSSRLIASASRLNPSFMSGTFNNPKSTSKLPHDIDSTYSSWTAPMVARGNMEVTTSYGKEWDILRKFPNEKFDKIPGKIRKSYLNSKTHAWFDYESEETIGMPNWNLNKGKPYHKIYSYEKDYSKGNIGRVLKFSEWCESQAWQALSGYEAWRKKRWLDYDGLNWCDLRGGPNTATYMKPLIEYGGQAKLAYYAIKMVYQRTLAGSKNVDLVYGPNDKIPVIVMNIDDAKTVTVRAVAKTLDGKKVAEKIFNKVKLKAGRNVKDLGFWHPALQPNRYYAFEYTVEGYQ